MEREDHVEAMAHLALAFRDRLPSICDELEISREDKAESLTLRIGIHTGPVTCELLRGSTLFCTVLGSLGVSRSSTNVFAPPAYRWNHRFFSSPVPLFW